MRYRFVALILGMVCSPLLASPQDAAPIKLSRGAREACAALAQADGSSPAILLVDVAKLDDVDTSTLLDALADLRMSKSPVFAVCDRPGAGVRDGAAMVALACDATVVTKGTGFFGAQGSWCTSDTRRERLGLTIKFLSGLDREFTSRFLSTDRTLVWSQDARFNASVSDPGAIKLADAGAVIACSADSLRAIGIDLPEFASIDDAVSAIAKGSIQPRTKSTAVASGGGGQRAPAGAAGTTRPGGSLGGNGKVGGQTGGNPGGTPPPPTPAAPSSSSPSTPKAAPTPTAPAPINEAKLAEEVAKYGASLGELKGLLREFNDYFKGIKGIWTSPNKGLKWVWDDRSDHTEHKDTKMICQRLQRDIKTKMSTLESCMKTVERIVKDKEHPELVRMKTNMAALDGLRAAFERNKVSNYETYYGQVMSLK